MANTHVYEIATGWEKKHLKHQWKHHPATSFPHHWKTSSCFANVCSFTFVLGPLHSIAPIFLALEMQPQKWWHMVQWSSRNQQEGKRVSLTGLGMRDGRQSTLLWAQDSDTWAALPAPCWQAEPRCGHPTTGCGVTSAGLAHPWHKD